MIARTQQFIIATWLAATLGWLLYFLSRERPAVAVLGALAIAGVHAIVLALEFVASHFVNRDDPAPRAAASQLVRAWWREVRTSLVVFGWRQPYCSTREPDHLPADSPGRRGVVLVHGLVCNRGIWNPWMRRLRAADVPFIAINLEPVLGPIERYPQLIDVAVRRLELATGQAPLIVAHSMGGLAARLWFNAFDGARRACGVITIGTPHQGTWMARFGFAHNARQMRQGSDWLATLTRAESAELRAGFTCFYSHCDNIVLPASTATLCDADNRHVAGVAHVHLVYHPAVLEEVLTRLAPVGQSTPGTAAASSPARAPP